MVFGPLEEDIRGARRGGGYVWGFKLDLAKCIGLIFPKQANVALEQLGAPAAFLRS